MATQDDVRSDLLELAERCEKATGPDREIDHSIGHALRWRDEHTIIEPVPMFTFSIDAAMTLVPEGWEWEIENGGSETYGPFVAKFGQMRDVEARTLPLAICAAALRARAHPLLVDSASNQAASA